jgi:hypothetical protein
MAPLDATDRGAKGETPDRERMMKKLMLELETLEVESFQTAGPQPARGTVAAADAGSTLPDMCITFTCGDSHIRACL